MTPATPSFSSSFSRRHLLTGAGAGALALSLSSCGGGDPLSSDSSAGAGDGDGIVVGSADFSESILLAEIYAGALNAAGVKASTHTGIGAREVYLKALTDGSVQVVPEYTGALAIFYDKTFNKTDPTEVYDALAGLLPADLVALKPSTAEDVDSLTVTKETADKYQLTSIENLKSVAGQLTLGAPPEFEKRSQGIPGLKEKYDLTFQSYRPIKGQQLVQSLKGGQVQVANLFSTDPAIQANGFVVLSDPKKLFGSQNIVPLVTKGVQDKVAPTLDKVSEKLTTELVAGLVKQVDIDHKDPVALAKTFLADNGLG